MLTKKEIFEALEREIEQKNSVLAQTFSDLNSAVTDDSKSTAGDKHETGRAMVHLEQEKLSQQLNILNEYQETLAKINPEDKHDKIQFGSLVKTNRGCFFFSVGIGKITIDNETIFCLTITTPIGNALVGKKVGEPSQFNGEIEIISIE